MPIARFLSSEREVLEPVAEDGERAHILVKREILVVRHAELQRFEAAHATLPPLDSAISASVHRDGRGRGAPVKYDWEGALCELVVIVNDEGVPKTQGELVDKLRDWFARQLGPDNTPSDSSIKCRISRIWPRIKPDLGRPSALHSIHGSSVVRPTEKKREGSA
jgi:hypothetical protein